MAQAQRDELVSHLNSEKVLDLSATLHDHACVSLILKGASFKDLQLAFIQRAIDETDRWSGQLAFPGGRHEPHDPSNLSTALRETKEEVGIELRVEDLLGRLNDIQGRKSGSLLDFYIRPYVFYVADFTQKIILDTTEVADFFWIPITDLTHPEKQTLHSINYSGTQINMPAVNMGRDVPLWGLTYMMCLDLLQRLRLK